MLERTGFECPSWEDLAKGRSPGESREEEDPSQPRAGWQQQVATSIDHDNKAWPGLREHEKAMMRSQRGPLASTPFTCFPTSRMTRIDPAPFRAFLLRRLRLPLPLAVHSTPLATTEQLARQQGSWGGEGGLQSRLRQEFAEGEPE